MTQILIFVINFSNRIHFILISWHKYGIYRKWIKEQTESGFETLSVTQFCNDLQPPQITSLVWHVHCAGVGGVFCQGVDLLYLVNDRPEKRKEAAAELAAGKATSTNVSSGFKNEM
jgi:hypothetical protein